MLDRRVSQKKTPSEASAKETLSAPSASGLRALSHDLRERVLVTFDDHGFIYDETVEEAECQKENTEMETFLNHSKALSHKLSKQKMF